MGNIEWGWVQSRELKVSFCVGLAVVGLNAPAQGWKVTSNLTFKAELTLKETYDDNVFILDTEPDPTITPPPGVTVSEANKQSLITTVIPGMSLNYTPCTEFAANVSYAPEFSWYHSAHSEDYIAHRGAINFNGKIDEMTYDWLNSVTWLDGSDLGYITIRPGDCRSVGGIPLRDRRDAAVFRNGLKVTIPADKWFVRPVVSALGARELVLEWERTRVRLPLAAGLGELTDEAPEISPEDP